MDDLVGRVIGPGGRYRLLAVIAHGGMGTVFQAEQLNLPRQVAIKVADPAMAQQPAFVQRFRQEIGALARLEHGPHILPVYDVGDEDGHLYMVMPLVAGGTLKDRLEQRRGQPWTLQETVPLARQVLEALEYAHERGFVHRDVKPSNILLEGNQAFLADFGIAKLLQDSGGGPLLGPTLTGTALVGSPTYMAPEQALGRTVDRRADLYAFGVVLYEMLVGKVPYQGDTPMEVAFQHVTAALPAPRTINPTLPAGVETVLLKALARDPEQRFESARACAQALDRALKEALADAGAERLAPAPATAPADDRFPDFEDELRRRLDRVQRSRRGGAGAPPVRVAPGRQPQPRPQPSAVRPAPAPPAAPSVPLASTSSASSRAPAVPVAPVAPVVPARQPVAATAPVNGSAAGSLTASPHPRRLSRRVWLVAGGAGGAALAAVAGVALYRTFGAASTTRATATPAIGASDGSNDLARPTTASPSPWWQLASARVSHSATRLSDGRVLVVGGLGSGGRYLASAELYDPASSSWAAADPLVRARAGHTATLLTDGQVLVTGGQDGDASYLAAAELYDPRANRWTPVEPLSSARADHTATLLGDGRVLVVGGKNDALYHATADVYEPRERRWRPASRLSGVRTSHAAVLLPSGLVLVVGGIGDDAATALATTELYNPSSNAWTLAGSLSQGRIGHTASLVAGTGQVVVAGGYYTAVREGQIGYVTPVATERYDPAANAWSAAGTMTQGRTAHAACLLANGGLLVAGGQNAGGGYLATAERYQPDANGWGAAGQMARARAGHVAVTLRDGQVLIIGGQDAFQPLASVERFDPNTGRWSAGG